MTKQVNAQQLQLDQEIEAAFNLFDKNNDGKITSDELKTVMRTLGHNPTNAELKRHVKELDTNKDGTVQFSEFKKFMTDKAKKSDPKKELLNAFRVFDRDGNGYVDATELRKSLTELGEKITAKEADEMIKSADADKDGRVNYEEFVKMMSKRPVFVKGK